MCAQLVFAAVFYRNNSILFYLSVYIYELIKSQVVFFFKKNNNTGVVDLKGDTITQTRNRKSEASRIVLIGDATLGSTLFCFILFPLSFCLLI